MNKFILINICLIILICSSCSKKNIPSKELEKPQVTAAEPSKPAPVKVIKTPVPKVITVNDSVAKKSVDGRLYYDLEGKRYWRNNKDGKYYKYYKGMQDDPAFKTP